MKHRQHIPTTRLTLLLFYALILLTVVSSPRAEIVDTVCFFLNDELRPYARHLTDESPVAHSSEEAASDELSSVDADAIVLRSRDTHHE